MTSVKPIDEQAVKILTDQGYCAALKDQIIDATGQTYYSKIALGKVSEVDLYRAANNGTYNRFIHSLLGLAQVADISAILPWFNDSQIFPGKISLGENLQIMFGPNVDAIDKVVEQGFLRWNPVSKFEPIEPRLVSRKYGEGYFTVTNIT